MQSKYTNSLNLILVFIFAVPLHAVTVNPALCPTNKIAPHKRIASWNNEYRPRTIGAFYDLLAPGEGQPHMPLNGLQEEPQKDDPNDCGDIADYDENDLSSVTQQAQRRRNENSKLHFSHLNNGAQYPQGYPAHPTTNRPVRPQRPGYPTPPTKSPFWSGGYFENNPYQPPTYQYPSDNVKPVHDGVYEPQTTYRPSIVGGPIGHIVGVSPMTPPPPSQTETVAIPQRYPNGHGVKPERPQRPHVTQSTQRVPNYVQFPTKHPEAPVAHPNRRPRPRKLNNNNVFGSFFDLLFK